MKKKNFKKFAQDEMIGFDKVVKHKDGTYSINRYFFYRHGMDSKKWAEKVYANLKAKGIEVEIISHTEHWNAWPKDSWFNVKVKPKGEWK